MIKHLLTIPLQAGSRRRGFGGKTAEEHLRNGESGVEARSDLRRGVDVYTVISTFTSLSHLEPFGRGPEVDSCLVPQICDLTL